MSLWSELRSNLSGFLATHFLATHRMQESSDWPEVRVRATVAALDRIRTYAREREERFAAYECGASSENYRRRWTNRRKVVDVDFIAGGR